MEFKSSLKKYRIDNKLTQDELGKKVGLSGKVISKWESGYSMPDIDNIKKLCEIFDCEYADLIGPEKKNKKKKAKQEENDISKEENNPISSRNIYNPSLRAIKKIARVLFVFIKVFRILLVTSVVLIILGMFIVPPIVSSVKVGNNSISFTDMLGEEISLTGEDILLKGDYILKYKDRVVDNTINFDVIRIAADIFDNVPREQITFQIEIFLVMIIISLLVSILAFYNLEIFLKNIRDNDLIFTADNVSRLTMATGLLIGVYVCDMGIYFLLDSFTSVNLYNNIGLNRVVRLFFMILMIYVFKYGYELQNKRIGKLEV